jgi:hypothetical protein
MFVTWPDPIFVKGYTVRDLHGPDLPHRARFAKLLLEKKAKTKNHSVSALKALPLGFRKVEKSKIVPAINVLVY